MKRSRLNFIIDLIAFAGFIVLSTTGVLMRYFLPPGSGSYSTIWGLDRHEWGGVHFWIGVVFLLVLALHLVLHWRWILNMFKGRSGDASGYRFGLGLVGFFGVIALAFSPLLTDIQKDNSRKAQSTLSSHKYDGISIRGSMSLSEVEESTGVPVDFILKSLELPETISKEQRLGALKKQYGFEINQVREIVKEYRSRN